MLSKNRVSLCQLTTVLCLVLTLAISTRGIAQEPGESHAKQLAEACKSNGGTWLESYQECEYVAPEWCASTGGRFDECASACRHNPEPATVCTMQCVPVCVFSEKKTKPDGSH